MALKHLVEGECGGSNPLMQWSLQFVHGKPATRGALHHDRLAELSYHGGKEEEEMVREFLQGEKLRPMVPQTFNMSSLLNEIQTVPQTQQPHPQQEVAVDSWIQEFGETHHPTPVKAAEQQWVEEFSGVQPASVQHWIEEFSGDPQSLEAEKWVQEFQFSKENKEDEISKVAQEISRTVTDPKIRDSEFMKFINKLGNGELKLETNEVTSKTSAEWEKEFLDEVGDQRESEEDFWTQLDEVWSGVKGSGLSSHPWLKEFEKVQEYQFVENNPMKNIDNPLEEGLKKLASGDLPAAVLLFEAAVQEHPESIRGWQYLGTSQAHNEQDMAAVTALERCLQLDPGNLDALQGLAVSYTNESQQSKACQALRKWLKLNPKYSNLVPEKAQVPDKPFVHSFMSKEEHDEVTSLFLRAARESVDNIDPDVQIGLGVLFNLSNEYEKAVDCFTAALQVRPDDAMLWNKLGATQANSNKSEEAIHSYRRALELAPGLTRSRYNLGISCINLNAHREAVEHFLMALNLQRNADAPPGMKTQMSQGIWSTLRLAILYLGRHDLLSLVDNRKLDELMKEFNV